MKIYHSGSDECNLGIIRKKKTMLRITISEKSNTELPYINE